MAETTTPKQPKVPIKSWDGKTLTVKSVNTQFDLTLIPTTTERGDKNNRWTYPGLGNETPVDKQFDLVTSFRSEAWLKQAATEAFNAECQAGWRAAASDLEKFTNYISDEASGRAPAKMSNYWARMFNDLAKKIKDAGRKASAEELVSLKEFNSKKQAALEEEMLAEIAALEG